MQAASQAAPSHQAGPSETAKQARTSAADAALTFAEAAHSNLQDLVKAADAKAAVLVTLQAIVFAIGGSEFVEALGRAAKRIGDTPIRWVKVDILFLLASATFAIAGLLSAIFAVRVVKPRAPDHIPQPPKARGFLWISALEVFSERPEDLPPPQKWRHPEEYVSELLAMDDESRTADFAFEHLKISWILRRKFRLLKKAMLWLIVALAAAGVSLVAWAALRLKYGT
jgi:hypothetical protein